MSIYHKRKCSVVPINQMTKYQRNLYNKAKKEELENEAKVSHREIIFGDYPDELV